MTKEQFLQMWLAMYRVGNLADSDSEAREGWTHPDMAGKACCRLLDNMAAEMARCGVLTDKEVISLYDNL